MRCLLYTSHDGERITVADGGMGGRGNIHFVTSTPVSYTHLDVYKRQDHGRIVEEGATAAVFGNPQSPVTRELLALSLIHI